MQFITLLPALSLLSGALAQSAYTDDNDIEYTNMKLSTDVGSGAGEFGIALPPADADDFSDEYIGRMVVPIPKPGTWFGLTHLAGMTGSVILLAWPNGEDVMTSFRYATGYSSPAPYTGNATLGQISSSVNDTHFELTYRCEHCFVWSQDGTDGSQIPSTKANARQVFGWAQGAEAPSDPTDPDSAIAQHATANMLALGIESARNAAYSDWTALATATEDPAPTGTSGGNGTTSAAPTAVACPDTNKNANQTYDYIIVGSGAGGIPAAAKLAESGKKVLLIERGPASSGRWGGTMKPDWLVDTNLTRFDVPGLDNEIHVNSEGIACTDYSVMAGCVLGGGTAINAGLWWNPTPLDFDENFPAGWKYEDMEPAIGRVFDKIPFNDRPSMDGKLYKPQGYNIVAGALEAAGWKNVSAGLQPAEKNLSYSHPNHMFSHGERGGPMATYLVDAKDLPNFTLMVNTTVNRVIRDGSAATGVEVEAFLPGGQCGNKCRTLALVSMRRALIRTLRGSQTLRNHSAFRTPRSHYHHSLSNMQLPHSSAAYVLAPELTWTGAAFERDVHVSVSADGLIQSVKHSSEAIDGDAAVHKLPGRALLPGMVNAHSHAFQRGLRGLGETYPKNSAQSSFWTWREEMYKLVGGMSEQQIYDLTRQCFSEMRDAGITSVGEFHYFHHGRPGEGKDGHEFAYDETVLRAAKDVGIRIVLLNAYYEHGGFQRAPMVESQKRFKVDSHEVYWKQMDKLQSKLADDPTQSVGVVAHSMRAVEVPDIVKLHEESVRRGLVFHIHLEEQTKEVDDCKAAHNGETPMGLLLKNLKIDEKFTAVHCTWTEAEELKQFVEKKGNVCICPLTEGNLGDGFPFIASCSDRVCLGTDCNARVDMCEEMRWLEYAHRLHESRRGVCTDATSETDLANLLIRYGTKNGAESLNLHVGEIKEGYAADFALIDIEEEQLKFSTPTSLMGAFIFGANGSSVVKATSVNGKWRETVSKKVQEEASFKNDEAAVSNEHKAQIEAAATLADVNSDDVVKLAIGLNSIVSTSGDEAAVGQAIADWLTARGWRVHMQKVPPQSDAAVKADRYNVYASRGDSKTPKLLFNSHMDTVPPYLPPRIDSTTLYGRGACDAKSLIAGQMIAAQKLVEAGFGEDVQVLFVVSEETDHSGMKKANELNINPAHMIVGEPTALKMSKMQKGVLKIQLTQKGVAAHSGYPHLGDSAIDPMIDVLYDLKKENWPTTEEYGNTDLNIGMLNGGQAANALAEQSSAMLMFRLVTDPDVIYKRVEEIVSGRVEMKLYTANAPVHLTTVEGYHTGVACFNTDIPYFNFDGKAYLVGAGSITDAHCPREFIMLEDLKSVVDYYFTLGKRLIEVGK